MSLPGTDKAYEAMKPREILDEYGYYRGDDSNGDYDEEKALSDLKKWVLGKKIIEHDKFCSSRPEWYDLETNGSCSCGMPAHNKIIEDLAKEMV